VAGRAQVDLLQQAAGFRLDQRALQQRAAAAMSQPPVVATASRGGHPGGLYVAGAGR
jgi:hypothetical protein